VDANDEPREKKRGSGNIQWHPAFYDAILLELENHRRHLSFVFEHILNAGPLKIDALIIKKAQGARIKKNIAQIFRGVNICEFKGPGDHLSIRDFLKVYAYACLYASVEKDADISDMTLTFVTSRQPKKLLGYLRRERGYGIEKKWPGVYIVSGDPLPIQLINSGELSAEENRWLKGLSDKLSPLEWREMFAKIKDRGGRPGSIKAYLDAIVRANRESLREAYEMSKDKMELDRMFEEIGLAAKWRAEGNADGEARTEAKILGLFRQGYTLEEVERMLAKEKERKSPRRRPPTRAARVSAKT